MWNLATRENWELILSERRNVVYKDNTLPSQDRYRYTPISPIYTTPNSHILLIGTQSNSALAHWFLGARASQYLYVSPSTTSNLISGVQTSEIKKLGLNRLTFVQFPNYNILPYTLQLEIPYWLEDIYIEVWEYQGVYADANQQYDDLVLRLDAIETQLDRIEEQLNTTTGQ